MTTAVRYLPVRPVRLSLDAFAAQAGLHPGMVRQLVALGLIAPDEDASGELWFRPSDVYRVARVERLRTDLSLNYAAIGLVMDLLDEIDDLHAAAARSSRR